MWLFIFLIVLLGIALFVYSWFIEPAILQVDEQTVAVDPAKLIGEQRFLFLSDLHFNKYAHPKQLRKHIEELKELQRTKPYQAILLGGDYIDYQLSYIPQLKAFLKDLGKIGVPIYGVMGNHDYASAGWKDVTPIAQALTEAGVTVLRNQSAVVKVGESRILLVGLEELESTDSYVTPKQKIPFDQYKERAKALDWYTKFDTDHPDLLRILLTHNPDGAYLPGAVAPTVVLAGHTHGGQMAWLDWWGRYLIPLIPRGSFITWAGRRLFGKSTLIVGRGFGGARFPIRLGRPPEAILLTLRPTVIPQELVIGISGKPRAGKDTVADMLENLLPGIHRVTFGTAIKAEYDAQNGTNTLGNDEEKIKHRDGINALGKKRRDEDRDYWVKKTINQNPPLLITDVRWVHEADIVHNNKGILIRVEASRATLEKRFGAEFHKHLDDHFESQLDDYGKWDYIVHNNTDLVDLEQQVQNIIDHI